MPVNQAAGLLMCRIENNELEFFLVHPGGPFFRKKDQGVWSIPKGLPNDGEGDLLITARREFNEETGLTAQPPFYELGSVKQKGGKIVHAWAFAGAWDPEQGIQCNTFRLEWPPKSGKFQEFPEMDQAAWMNFEKATQYLRPEQIPLLERAAKFFMTN
jgi:predicted NUDIX family NTP pyrophosphohydrolase